MSIFTPPFSDFSKQRSLRKAAPHRRAYKAGDWRLLLLLHLVFRLPLVVKPPLSHATVASLSLYKKEGKAPPPSFVATKRLAKQAFLSVLFACQALLCFLCRNFLHGLAAALNAAVFASAVDQHLDHGAAFFANYDLIHLFTPLFIKSFEQTNDFIHGVKLAVF